MNAGREGENIKGFAFGIDMCVGGVDACGGVFCVGDEFSSVFDAVVTGGEADPFESENQRGKYSVVSGSNLPGRFAPLLSDWNLFRRWRFLAAKGHPDNDL